MIVISDGMSYVQTALLRVAKSNPKRDEVHQHVDRFFDSLDGITEQQADWELDLLQDAVLRMMEEARKA